jgi:hypothetical protein
MTVALVLHRAGGAPVSTSFRRAAFGKDDPFARHREIAWEGPGSMSAGRLSFIGELDVASYPHIETLVVVEGEVTLTAAGAAPLVLGPQAGAVIGCGTELRIVAESRTRFVFCAAACDQPTKRGLIPLRADADFKAVQAAAGGNAAGPAPQCRSDNVFTDDAAQYRRRHLGFDTVPPDRPSASPQRVHASRGRQRAFRSADGSVLSVGTAMRCSCPRARRSDGKAAIASRSSTCAKASR